MEGKDNGINETEKALNGELDQDSLWWYNHGREIEKKYPGKCVAIVNHKVVAVGDSIAEVGREARRKHPSEVPLLKAIPESDDGEGILIL